MKEAGLVRSVYQGRDSVWQIESAQLEEAQRCIELLTSRWDAAIDRLRTPGGRGLEDYSSEPSRTGQWPCSCMTSSSIWPPAMSADLSLIRMNSSGFAALVIVEHRAAMFVAVARE